MEKEIGKDLVKLKDLSELMLEFAYSSVFLHDSAFAKQTRSLYREFKETYENLQKKISKAKKNESVFLSRLIVYIKEIATNAVYIAETSDFEKLPGIVRNTLQQSDQRIIKELVHFSSFFVGRTIGQLKILTHTKAKIIAVKRNDEWIFNIGKDFRFKAKDLIIGVGNKKSGELLKNAVNESRLASI